MFLLDRANVSLHFPNLDGHQVGIIALNVLQRFIIYISLRFFSLPLICTHLFAKKMSQKKRVKTRERDSKIKIVAKIFPVKLVDSSQGPFK